MKPAIRIISYVLILALGLGTGFYFGSRYSQSISHAFDMAHVGYYMSHMEMQMSEGTDASREEAIHNFLAQNEKRKEQPSIWLTEKILATDSALAYARLAALAQKRGSTQEAQKYMTTAVSFCPQIGWEECSAEKINYVVHRLDRTGIFVGNAPK